MVILARIALWLLVILLGLELGAGLYETRIVVPLWSAGVPETLAEGNPFGRVAIDAGMRLWAILTSAVALLAVVALVLGFWAAAPQRGWQIAAAIIELLVVAATLGYFRPVLIRLFMGHGAGLSRSEIVAIVNRWVMLSRVRVVVSLIAWLVALYALSK